MSCTFRKGVCHLQSFVLSLAWACCLTSEANSTAPSVEKGRNIYNHYCYQCHGYSGDARTLASTFVDPAPRDFTESDPAVLTVDAMVEAIRSGREGTAMVSFSSVLNTDELGAVVRYIRQRFMSGTESKIGYHSTENGWAEHDRFLDAFPFVTGQIPLDISWESLSDRQRYGRRLFMNACVVCHDNPSRDRSGPEWELEAVSYPYEYHDEDDDSHDNAEHWSIYALHDIAPGTKTLSSVERRGRKLYQDNCAHCHAADGTGRNWIGSFLDPGPENFGVFLSRATSSVKIGDRIRNGVPGTSMPSWKHVLSDSEIESIIAYMKRAFGDPVKSHRDTKPLRSNDPQPGWKIQSTHQAQ